MTEDATVTIAEIRTLVSERQRFDEWLSALEARRSETPVRVFERVYGDYVARRDGVIAQLHEHVGTLESLERDLTARLQSLETKLAEREDERAEAMLRTAVGEFDAERWEHTRHGFESSITELGEQRESLVAEAEDTRALLASARHRPAGAKVEPLAAQVAAAATAASEHLTPSTNSTAGDDIEAAFESSAQSDSPYQSSGSHAAEHTKSVNANTESAQASPVAAAQSMPANSDDVADIDVDVERAVNLLEEAPGATAPDTLDNIDVYGEPATSARVSSADNASMQSDARSHRSNAPGANGTASNATASNGGSATRDAFDDLAFLRSVTATGNGAGSTNQNTRRGAASDQTKTLRCTECGTMNFPTEWYCERCGGELATF